MKSVTEAAEATGLSDGYIRRLCARGAIPGAVKAGAFMWLIPDGWITAQRGTSDGYVSLAEAAGATGVTRQYLHQLIKAGDLRAVERHVYSRRRWFIERASLAEWQAKRLRKARRDDRS